MHKMERDERSLEEEISNRNSRGIEEIAFETRQCSAKCTIIRYSTG
jgi:hypothetical protein